MPDESTPRKVLPNEWPSGRRFLELPQAVRDALTSVRVDKGDLDEGFRRDSAKHDANPLAYYNELITNYISDIEVFLEGLSEVGHGDETFRATVTQEFHELARRAMLRKFPAYHEANRRLLDVIETSVYQANLPQMEYCEFLLDGSNLEETLTFLQRALDEYQRKLQIYGAIAYVANHGKTRDATLQGAPWAELERAVTELPHGVPKEVLLDDEYRHIRNAFAHGSYIPNLSKRQVTFRDHPRGGKPRWERDYSFADFAVLFNHFMAVFLGIQTARAFEVLDTMEAKRGEVERRMRE